MTDTPGSGQDPLKHLEGRILRHLEQNEIVQAQRLLRRHKKTFEGTAGYWILEGRILAAKKQSDKAVQAFEKAIAVDPSRMSNYVELAQLYANVDAQASVIATLRRGVEKSGDPLASFGWLEGYLTTQRLGDEYREAIHWMQEFMGDDDRLVALRAEKLAASMAMFSSVDLCLQCLLKGHRTAGVYLRLADTLTAFGYFDRALFLFCQCIRAGGQFPAAYQGVITCLQRTYDEFDEKLLAALNWRLADVSGDLRSRYNHLWYGLSDTELERYLAEWLSEDGVDENILQMREYWAIAEFVRAEYLKRDEFEFIQCDPVRILEQCAKQLTRVKAVKMGRWYRAWVEAFRGEHGRAYRLFQRSYGAFALTETQHRQMRTEMDKYRPEQPVADQRPKQADKPLDGRPIVGLDTVVERMMQVLGSDHNRSVILTGPPGIGKSAAVRELERRMSSKECPERLQGFSIGRISTTTLLSGAKYIGTWQERLEELCRDNSLSKKRIIYFEDLQNVIGAGRTHGDQSSFVDYLLPRISDGSIAVIGELDAARFRLLLGAEPQFEAHFTEIPLTEPSGEVLMNIIRQTTAARADNGFRISDAALAEAVVLTDVFLPYRAFPGKAIELIERTINLFPSAATSSDKNTKREGEAAAQVELGPDEVTLAFCEYSGVPDLIVDQRQVTEPGRMKEFFSDRVLGQDPAVEALMVAVQAFKARLTDRRRPIRSVLFVGPTGVGKTEAARVLAEYLFGSGDRMIRLNMSEYSGPLAVDKLLAAPGGSETRSDRFLDHVRRQPFSVVLLDEIEKANPEVLNLLLQLLDEGTLTDERGQHTFFQSAVIIMTSNIGSRRYTSRSIGFGDGEAGRVIEQSVLTDVKEFFSPEIFNRFDEVVCFRPLSQNVLGTIINREVGKVLERRGVVDRDIMVEIDPAVKNHILESGYDPRYGARHLRRAVESAVAVPLARLFSSTVIGTGTRVSIKMDHGRPVAAPRGTPQSRRLPEGQTMKIPGDGEAGEIQRPGPVPARDLAKVIASLETRIKALKSRLNYDSVRAVQEEIQANMNEPTFWDDPKKANQSLRKLADLNRVTERVHRWEDTYQRVVTRSTRAATGGRMDRHEVQQAKDRLTGLLHDIESAEMEILLEGRYDNADTFVLLRTRDGDDGLKWMATLANVYVSWARRRGYRYQFVGEQIGPAGKGVLLLHIGGLNSFGLLKNERGIHRRSVTRKAGRKLKGGERHTRVNIDCEVLVLADVQSAEESSVRFDIRLKKVSPARRGLKLKSLSRQVSLSHKPTETMLDLLTDSKVDRDRHLFGDMFLSFIHYRESNRVGPSTEEFGSLVRTLVEDERARVMDHRTGIVITNPRDYLTGKIDALLLERLV